MSDFKFDSILRAMRKIRNTKRIEDDCYLVHDKRNNKWLLFFDIVELNLCVMDYFKYHVIETNSNQEMIVDEVIVWQYIDDFNVQTFPSVFKNAKGYLKINDKVYQRIEKEIKVEIVTEFYVE